MPQALLNFDGNPSPYDQAQLSVAVAITNVDVGGEFQWDFTLVKKPLGSAATLIGAGNSRTLIPDEEGTYIIQVVVNNDPSLTNTGATAVLYYPSNLREPAPREQLEWDSTNGWSDTLNDVWERANHGVGTKPAASSSVWGRLWHSPGGVGVEDDFEACLKDDTDTYNWVDLTSKEDSKKRFTVINKSFADTGSTLTVEELDDTYIRVDTNGGAVILNMPTGIADINGIKSRIKRLGVNSLTLVPDGGQTIELGASLVFSLNRAAFSLTYIHAALDWEIF